MQFPEINLTNTVRFLFWVILFWIFKPINKPINERKK